MRSCSDGDLRLRGEVVDRRCFALELEEHWEEDSTFDLLPSSSDVGGSGEADDVGDQEVENFSYPVRGHGGVNFGKKSEDELASFFNDQINNSMAVFN